jgi:hypothetical protein
VFGKRLQLLAMGAQEVVDPSFKGNGQNNLGRDEGLQFVSSIVSH